MKYYINYSDEAFRSQQNFALKMAKIRGGFDHVTGYSKKDIEREFYSKNYHILSQPKGGGYWLWKPYFIQRKLIEIDDGDYLFYSDSGAFFLKSVDLLINEMERRSQDIMAFELPLIESQWTKKELFLDMDCDTSFYMSSNQVSASFQLIKKTEHSIRFYQELLENSLKEENITDCYNLELKQESDYIDHRHDQSIFSLLYKKHKLRPYKDPSQLGEYPRGYAGYPIEGNMRDGCVHVLENGRKYRAYQYEEAYSDVLFHSRKREAILTLIKHFFGRLLYGLKLYKGMF